MHLLEVKNILSFSHTFFQMAGNQRVDLVYTLELTRGGLTGFDFPENQIGQLVRETFHGYRAIGLHIGRTYTV